MAGKPEISSNRLIPHLSDDPGVVWTDDMGRSVGSGVIGECDPMIAK
jgi:hypothetical protein